MLFLFFGGLLALWIAPRLGVPTAQERRRLLGRLLPELIDLPTESIRRIEIVGGPEPLRFERLGTRAWALAEPRTGLADAGRIESLLTQLKQLAPLPDAGTIAGDPARFGLDPPARTVRLYAADARKPVVVLALGETRGSARYVQPESGGIEVVDARFVAVDTPADSWRERRLLPAFPFDIQKLRIERRGQVFELEHEAAGWRVTVPYAAPADEQAVGGLLADLVGQTAEGFADDPAAVAEPWLTVTVITTAGVQPPLFLEVGAAAPGMPGRYVARRGADLLLVAGPALEKLGTEPLQFRGKRPLTLDAARAQAFVLKEGEYQHLLVRRPAGWEVLGPEPGPADARVVGELLNGLDALRAVGFETEIGLGRPTAEIQLWQGEPLEPSAGFPERAPDGILRLGRQDERRRIVFAQTEGDAVRLLLPDSARLLIPQGRFAFRERSLLSLPRERIASIQVEHGGRTVTVVRSGGLRDQGRWRMTRPVAAPVDARAVAQLELLLSRLRAASLVAEQVRELQPYGLDPPWAAITWTLADEAGTGTIALGSEVPDRPGQRFATIAGSGRVFTLAREAIALMTSELRERTILAFPPDQAQRLRFRWPDGRSWTVVRHDQPFRDAPDWTTEAGTPPVGLDSQAVLTLVRLAANLTGTRYTQYDGPFPPHAGLTPARLDVEIELAAGLGTRRLRLGRNADAAQLHATTELADTGAIALLPAAPFTAWLVPAPNPELPENVFTR